jgi:hypothetical protein
MTASSSIIGTPKFSDGRCSERTANALELRFGIEADPSIIDDLGTPSEDEVRSFLACESDPDYRGYSERRAMYTGATRDAESWTEAA